MYGYQPYNYAVDEINRMCKEIYGEEARGMTIEDVNECLNYKNPKGMGYYSTTWYETQNLTTKLKDLGEDYGNNWTAIINYNTNNKGGVFYDPSNPEGIKDNGTKLGEYNLDGYWYQLSDDGTYLVNRANTADTSHTITTTTKNLVFGESNYYGYWLASRGVSAGSTEARFSPSFVNVGYVFNNYCLFESTGKSWMYTVSLRAVVSLGSDIPAVVE